MDIAGCSKHKTTRFDASRGIAKSRHCAASSNAPVAQTKPKSRIQNRKHHARYLDMEILSPANVSDLLEI